MITFASTEKGKNDMEEMSKEQRLIEILKSVPIERRVLLVQAYAQKFGGASTETGDIIRKMLKGE